MGSTGGGGSDPSQGGRQGGSEWDRQQGRSESERQQGGGGRPESQQEQKGYQNRGQGEPGRDRRGQNSAMKRKGAVFYGGPPFGTVRRHGRLLSGRHGKSGVVGQGVDVRFDSGGHRYLTKK